ncbi:MAG TPA: TonB-dependent receptor [Gemmatimonadaceae bacterium]
MLAALAHPASAQLATLSGRVTDAQTDSAVAEAYVFVSGSLLRTLTDAHGAYALHGVAPGTHMVRVLIVGYQSAARTVTFAAGETHEENFSLQPALLQLAPVTVTASRGTQLIGDVPASQAVVTRRDLLNRNIITLDQALRFVPGVSFNDGDIDIRGSTGAAGGVGSRVLMLVDGHPVLSADGGEVDFNSLPLLDVDRVEVVKGAYSALWGSNALGGVVNIITTPIDSTPETVGTLHYGAYDQPPNYRADERYPSFSGFMLQHSRQIGAVGVRGMVDRETSNGFREDDHSSRWLFRGKMDLPSVAGNPASASVIYSSQNSGNFFMWDSPAAPTRPPANTLNDWQHDTKLSAGATLQPIDRSALRLQIDPYFEKDGTQNHFFSDSDFSFHNATKFGTNAQLTMAPSVSQVLIMGGEVAHTAVSSDILGNPSLDDYGLYAQDAAELSRFVNTTLGLRLDGHQATGSSNELTLNPKLGIIVRPSQRVGLRASLARGYRAPAAIEQFVNSRQSGIPVHPNPNLHGETAWSAEFGAAATVTPWFWVDGAVFESDYHDLIGPGIIPDSGIVFQFQNVQRARIRGIDVATKTDIVPRLVALDLNYTMLNTYDYGFHGPLPYRSKHYITGSLELLGGLTGIDLSYRSRVERVLLFPVDPRGSITLVDLRLGYPLFGSFVQAKISNLFQQRYVDIMERTPGAPRSLLLSLRRTF